jgi:hypothetical protein
VQLHKIEHFLENITGAFPNITITREVWCICTTQRRKGFIVAKLSTLKPYTKCLKHGQKEMGVNLMRSWETVSENI